MLVVNSLCKNIFLIFSSKFPVFSLSGKMDFQIPYFPCAVATLVSVSHVKASTQFHTTYVIPVPVLVSAASSLNKPLLTMAVSFGSHIARSLSSSGTSSLATFWNFCFSLSGIQYLHRATTPQYTRKDALCMNSVITDTITKLQ